MPDQPKAIDWSVLQTNEALEGAMIKIMKEIALSPEEVSAMSVEDVERYYRDTIQAKGYPYGFRLEVAEVGDAGQKSVKGFSASPFDREIIYFWDR